MAFKSIAAILAVCSGSLPEPSHAEGGALAAISERDFVGIGIKWALWPSPRSPSPI
jgi:hypothetical protein